MIQNMIVDMKHPSGKILYIYIKSYSKMTNPKTTTLEILTLKFPSNMALQ